MKYILKSSFPCLIKTEKEFVELDENDTAEIENENFLFVYPQNKQIPFYINLTAPKENENFSIIKHGKDEIIFLENQNPVEMTAKENLNFSGKTCEIKICGNKLFFETDNKTISFTCPHKCKSYKIFKIRNYACVQFSNDLYVFSVDKPKLMHFSGDDIEISDNIIKISKLYHDSMEREKTATYKVEDEIVAEKESFMYKETISNRQLLPYKLLESVKAKDFDFVINSLSEKLKTQIDKEQIKSFFGEISSFFPLTTTEYIVLSQGKKNYVTFSLSGDKIDDIVIDNI